MTIVALQPQLRPKWKIVDNVTVPDVDANGLQFMEPTTTYHQWCWPSDGTVSQISANTWFTVTRGWDDTVSDVAGELWLIGTNADASPKYLGYHTFDLGTDREFTILVPPGTKKYSVKLKPHKIPVYCTLEVKAK